MEISWPHSNSLCSCSASYNSRNYLTNLLIILISSPCTIFFSNWLSLTMKNWQFTALVNIFFLTIDRQCQGEALSVIEWEVLQYVVCEFYDKAYWFQKGRNSIHQSVAFWSWRQIHLHISENEAGIKYYTTCHQPTRQTKLNYSQNTYLQNDLNPLDRIQISIKSTTSFLHVKYRINAYPSVNPSLSKLCKITSLKTFTETMDAAKNRQTEN